MAEFGGLTDGRFSRRQERALVALVSACGVREAALASGIGERSLHRYMADEAFRAELISLYTHIYRGALMRAEAIAARAIEVLEEVLNDPGTSTGHKIAAAREVLAVAQRHYDQRTAPVSNGTSTAGQQWWRTR